MPDVKFSHEYLKLWYQKKGELLAVRIIDAQAVAKNKDLIEYDTKYYKENPTVADSPFGYYPLPKTGKLIQLVFIGDKDIPFCTLRRHTEEKYKYYNSLIGKIIDVVMEYGETV